MGLEQDRLRDIVRKSEIKRIAENLSKKELCNTFSINYNFYNNCVTMRDLPSPQMAQILNEYLKTPTSTVYKKVFAYRSTDAFVGNRSIAKFVKRGSDWKETFHRSTGIDENDYYEFVKEMKDNHIYED